MVLKHGIYKPLEMKNHIKNLVLAHSFLYQIFHLQRFINPINSMLFIYCMALFPTPDATSYDNKASACPDNFYPIQQMVFGLTSLSGQLVMPRVEAATNQESDFAFTLIQATQDFLVVDIDVNHSTATLRAVQV